MFDLQILNQFIKLFYIYNSPADLLSPPSLLSVPSGLDDPIRTHTHHPKAFKLQQQQQQLRLDLTLMMPAGTFGKLGNLSTESTCDLIKQQVYWTRIIYMNPLIYN